MSCAGSASMPDTEARMRSAYPKLTGMLVVDDVQPGSAADGVLSPGDILVGIDGKPIPEFFALEDVLDSHVGPASQGRSAARPRDAAARPRRAILERHHRRRVHRIWRGRGAHAVLPAGTAFQRADQGRVRREPRLCIRQRGHSARRLDQFVQRQEGRQSRGIRGRARGSAPTAHARRSAT